MGSPTYDVSEESYFFPGSFLFFALFFILSLLCKLIGFATFFFLFNASVKAFLKGETLTSAADPLLKFGAFALSFGTGRMSLGDTAVGYLDKEVVEADGWSIVVRLGLGMHSVFLLLFFLFFCFLFYVFLDI